VDTDRDQYTRHGLHLNAHGKEHVANKNAAVINDLFSQKVSPITALKWKEQGDTTSYPTENQPLCVKEADVSGWNKMFQSQSYQKADSVDYIECDGLSVSSEVNQVLKTQVPKESICLAKGIKRVLD
jgi:hypothetical protein